MKSQTSPSRFAGSCEKAPDAEPSERRREAA
jgi:hypothetical protein